MRETITPKSHRSYDVTLAATTRRVQRMISYLSLSPGRVISQCAPWKNLPVPARRPANSSMARTKECVRRAHADAQASQRAARRAAGIRKASRLASVEEVEAAQVADQVCSWLHGARARPPPESLPCHAAVRLVPPVWQEHVVLGSAYLLAEE